MVSGVDNVLRPYLISRGSNLPLILVFLGVVGGVLAFGFLGVFLGPTLLAIGYVLVEEWSAGAQRVAAPAGPEAAQHLAARPPASAPAAGSVERAPAAREAASAE